MKLVQEVPYTHAFSRPNRNERMSPKTARKIDAVLAESGLSLLFVEGEGRVNLSGLPITVGDEILERIRHIFQVHVAYNRRAYDGQKDR